jgi:hypothetical protein
MSEVPQYTQAVVQSLSLGGLFDFSGSAREQIDSFYFGHNDTSPNAAEQGRALSYLHAAEYALLPVITNPSHHVRPFGRSTPVSTGDAQLALMKGDCSLIIWTHASEQGRINSLHISDLTAFSGDASKIRHVMIPWPEDMVPSTSEVEIYSRELYRLHLGEWEPAVDVAMSGAIQLQGLLWCLKSAVVEYRTESQFRQYLEYVPEYLSGLGQQPWTPEGDTLSERAGLSEGPAFSVQWQQLSEGSVTDEELAERRYELQIAQATTMYERGALTDEQLAAARARYYLENIIAMHDLGAMSDEDFDEERGRLLGT